jgi:Fe-S-cluster-containing hydrogenase component 2
VSNLLFIDSEKCTGCAVCQTACPTGAISLNGDGGVATIDATLCDECLICIEACPNGAIQRLEPSALTPAPEVVEGEIVEEAMPPATAHRPGRVVVLAGTALSYLGNWLLPRLADALVGAVERRLTPGPEAAISDAPRPVRGRTTGKRDAPKSGRGRGRGRRRRRRRRGG